jgi:hypothetical protein
LRGAGDDGDASTEIDGVGHWEPRVGRRVAILNGFSRPVPAKSGASIDQRMGVLDLASTPDLIE